MTSYTPEHSWGLIPGTYDQYGLVPWPKHLQPGEAAAPDASSGIELTKKGEAYAAAHEKLPDIDLRALFSEGEKVRLADVSLPALAEADGIFFLMLDSRDRTMIATTVERLIGMLDTMEGDADLEPSLGSATCAASPYRGHMVNGALYESRDRTGSQLDWSNSGDVGEREVEESGFGDLGGMNEEMMGEPDLGWPEQVDQVGRLDLAKGWLVEDGEPWLGWPEGGPQRLNTCMHHDDREVVDEDGGDILDEPHDAEEDCCEAKDDWGGRGYAGDGGARIAADLLHSKGLPSPHHLPSTGKRADHIHSDLTS